MIAGAYDDAAGVTAKFNLNLLTRINRELGGHFDLDKFSHYANYRPIEGSARSFLISKEQQTVRIDALDREFRFRAMGSDLYGDLAEIFDGMIEQLADESGFAIKQNFFDTKGYYCDSLWQPA